MTELKNNTVEQIRYSALTEEQEQPEEMPNPLCWALAEVVNLPHYTIHKALLKVDALIHCDDTTERVEPADLVQALVLAQAIEVNEGAEVSAQ
jgi:hypothetical protein